LQVIGQSNKTLSTDGKETMKPKRISILGVGLLGGSIGLAAKSSINGCKIIGYGHRPATLSAAMSKGAIDEAFNSPAQAVQNCDLVILCTPVGMFGELLAQIAQTLSPEAIVTDVGSTKRSVVEFAERHLANPARFVGSHPIAGSEKRGVEFARADLFKSALCITTPTPQTDPTCLEAVESFWRLLGMRLSRLTPQEHDRLLAEVSHLPHALAAALVAMPRRSRASR
jgi:prephenate dehydrogenase